MAKVVVNKTSPITVNESSFVIYDHKVTNNQYTYYYRVKLNISSTSGALKGMYDLRITRESPLSNRPNMFKNLPGISKDQVKRSITNFDESRLNAFKKNITAIKKVPITYQDMLRGFIEFELEDAGSQILYSTITRSDLNVAVANQVTSIDNGLLISRYAFPKSDFIIGTSRVFRNKTRIVITPTDKRISKFKIYNTVKNLNQGLLQLQDTPDTVIVTNSGFAYIDIDDTGSRALDIRVTPVSYYKNITNNTFKQVTINEGKKYNDQCIILPSIFTGSSVTFRVLNLPDNLLSIDLIRQNLTRNERSYSYVATSNNLSSILNVIDPNVPPYATLSYKIKLHFKDGTQKVSAASYILNPKILETAVSLRVSEQNLATDDLNATRTFLTEVSYKQITPTQQIITDLKTLGIDNIFPNEIKNISTQLDPLIGILVTRIDLESGVEQSLGVFKPGEISDTFSKLIPCTYIFEVVLKSPSETIEDIGSSRSFSVVSDLNAIGDPMIASRALGISTFTKNPNYTQKFFNKSALYYGRLKYGNTLSSLESGVENGRTSIFKTLYATPQYVNPKLSFVKTVSRIDDKIVTWSCTNMSNVTRFIVLDTTTPTNTRQLHQVISDPDRTEYSISIPIGVKKIRIEADFPGEVKNGIEVEV